MIAADAAKPEIHADPENLPLVASAGMGLFQFHNVSDLIIKFHKINPFVVGRQPQLGFAGGIAIDPSVTEPEYHILTDGTIPFFLFHVEEKTEGIQR